MSNTAKGTSNARTRAFISDMARRARQSASREQAARGNVTASDEAWRAEQAAYFAALAHAHERKDNDTSES